MMVEPLFLLQLHKGDSLEVYATDIPLSNVCAKISQFSDYTCAPGPYCIVSAALNRLPLGATYNAYTSRAGTFVVTKTVENSTLALNTESYIRYRPLPPSDDESDPIEDAKKGPNAEAYLRYKIFCVRNLGTAAKWLCAQYTIFVSYLNNKYSS
jgi:hypothetical protein